MTGQKINDLSHDGSRVATHVYKGATLIASEYDVTVFQFTDPISGSTIGGEHGRNELAGLGTSVPETEPPSIPTPNYNKGGNALSAEFGCMTIIDGQEVRTWKCTQSQLAGADGFERTIYKGWWVSKTNAKRLGVLQLMGGTLRQQRLFLKEVGTPGTFSVLGSATFLNLGGVQTQSGSKAKLSERDQKQYETQRAGVLDRLDNISKKCRDFLEKAGLAVSDVISAVKLQQAYDGEKSTISMNDAGYYEEGSLSQFAPERRAGLLNQRMSDFIPKNAKAATALFPGGQLGNTVAERSTVYFQIDYSNGVFGLGRGYKSNSGLTQSIILHEAIHSLSGLRDKELYTLLTGKTANAEDSSRGISEELKDNDCIE